MQILNAEVEPANSMHQFTCTEYRPYDSILPIDSIVLNISLWIDTLGSQYERYHNSERRNANQTSTQKREWIILL